MEAIMKDNHMNAMVYTTYGSPDVLQLTQVEKPHSEIMTF